MVGVLLGKYLHAGRCKQRKFVRVYNKQVYILLYVLADSFVCV